MTKKRYVNAGVVYSRKTQYLKHEYFIFMGVKETRKKMSDVTASQQMKEIPDKRKSEMMNYLKWILTGGLVIIRMKERLENAKDFWKKYYERKELERLEELTWGADLISRQRSLNGIGKEWINEVKRLFEIVGINNSDENIVKEISRMIEEID